MNDQDYRVCNQDYINDNYVNTGVWYTIKSRMKYQHPISLIIFSKIMKISPKTMNIIPKMMNSTPRRMSPSTTC